MKYTATTIPEGAIPVGAIANPVKVKQSRAAVIFNYTANRYEYTVSKRTADGITTYRTIDDRTFTSLDADPERHAPLTDELSAELLEALAEIAIADPTEAIDLFKLLPEHHKPQLRARLKSLPPEAHKALKQAAQEAAIAPQPNEEPQQACCNASQQAQDDRGGESGLPARAVFVHLVDEPGWLVSAKMVPIHKGDRQTSRSDLWTPLADKKRMGARDADTRNKAIKANINGLILLIKAWDKTSPKLKELMRIAKRVRAGEETKLGGYCKPHGDAIALVVNAIADKVPRAEIIERLEKLLPVEQPVLLET